MTAKTPNAKYSMEAVSWSITQMSHGRTVTTDFELPVNTKNESCSIILDSRPKVVDRFSLKEISVAVEDIRRVCIRDRKGLGGQARVGNGVGIVMYVLGIVRPPCLQETNETKAVMGNKSVLTLPNISCDPRWSFDKTLCRRCRRRVRTRVILTATQDFCCGLRSAKLTLSLEVCRGA